MTKPAFSVPRRWASDTNYSSGPDNGTPTKVDPGSARAAQGWLPGDPVAAQHLNDLMAGAAAATRRQLAIAALRTRATDIDDAETGSSALGAAAVGPSANAEGLDTVIVKGENAYSLDDSDVSVALGTLPVGFGVMRDVAYDGTSRFLAVGVGGTRNASSTDGGVTWAAGGTLAPCYAIVRDATHGKFLAIASSGNAVSNSTNGTAWTSVSTSLTSAQGGIAVLSSGRVVVCGVDGASFPRMSLSNDGGATWADASGHPDDSGAPGAFLTEGYICGNGGSEIWHVGTRGSPSSGLKVSVSTDGNTWTTRAEFTTADDNLPPAAVQPSGTDQPRILCCQNTGMLVIVAPASTAGPAGRTFAIASFDGGFTWTEPAYFAGVGITQYAVASGKLYHNRGALVLQSDGVGWR